MSAHAHTTFFNPVYIIYTIKQDVDDNLCGYGDQILMAVKSLDEDIMSRDTCGPSIFTAVAQRALSALQDWSVHVSKELNNFG